MLADLATIVWPDSCGRCRPQGGEQYDLCRPLHVCMCVCRYVSRCMHKIVCGACPTPELMSFGVCVVMYVCMAGIVWLIILQSKSVCYRRHTNTFPGAFIFRICETYMHMFCVCVCRYTHVRTHISLCMQVTNALTNLRYFLHVCTCLCHYLTQLEWLHISAVSRCGCEVQMLILL